jgi:hypothetical protein
LDRIQSDDYPIKYSDIWGQIRVPRFQVHTSFFCTIFFYKIIIFTYELRSLYKNHRARRDANFNTPDTMIYDGNTRELSCVVLVYYLKTILCRCNRPLCVSNLIIIETSALRAPMRAWLGFFHGLPKANCI